MSKKPNIVFLMTDQQRWDAIGYENPSVKTPNLDKLAQKGIRFRQSVCQDPLCVASRYSMMLGLYPFQMGVRHNQQMYLKDDDLPMPVIAQRFFNAGYDTAGIGKTHWYVKPKEQKPVKSVRGFGYRAQKHEPDHFVEDGATIQEYDANVKTYGQECTGFGGGGQGIKGYTGNSSKVPADKHAEAWMTDKALEYLDTRAEKDDPFMLYLSFDAPHPGFNVPSEFEKMYDISEIEDRPIADIENQNDHAWPTVPTLQAVQDHWQQMSPDERRKTTLRYYALCTYVDWLFGKVIDKIDQIGKTEDTLFVFTSDHGEMLGDRNHRFSKCCLYEGSVRVPLFFTGAGVDKSLVGKVDNTPVEHVDILPTLMEAAGIEPDFRLPGINLLSSQRKPGSFSEYHGQGYEQRQYGPAWMWRNEKYKLIMYFPCDATDAIDNFENATGQLYDLEKDPIEVNNLYDDENYRDVREKMMREMLLNTMIAGSKFPFPYSNMKFE